MTESNVMNDEKSLTGGQVVALRQGGVLSYLFSDHLPLQGASRGSTTVTTDSSGTKIAEMRYKPCPQGVLRDPQGVLREGETRYTSGTTPTARHYTGQYEESGIGLYFYNARWYDPVLGRFAQADSLIPQPGNPLAWDRHAYGLNNPLKFIDPTGHAQALPEDGGLDPEVILIHLDDEYDWNMLGDWNNKQLLAAWNAAIELRHYVGNARGEDGIRWMNNNFGGITFSIDAPITQLLNSSVTPTDNRICLIKDFEKIRWEQGVVGHVLHEVGHIFDNRVGLNSPNAYLPYVIGSIPIFSYPVPAVFTGGGPADALYGFMGGVGLRIPRFSGGVSFANDQEKAFDIRKYPYGNNSSADYFAHTLAISMVDSQAVPENASLWMASFISLLP